jgi:uncharacterized membrane protein
VVKITLLYDESHEEPGFKKYYSELSSYLNEKGEKTEVLTTSPITKELLKNYDVLIVSFPQRSFDEEEIRNIVEFVENGGGLFLAGEEFDFNHFKTNLNSISKRFNIEFNDDEVLDPKNKPLNSKDQIGDCYFTVKEFKDHPITKGLEELVIFGGCSLKLNGESMVVLKGSEYSYSSEGYYNGGEFPPILSVLEYEKGKVVCLGDGSLLRDNFINEGNNKQLVLNILRWLSAVDEQVELSEDEEMMVKGIEELEHEYYKLDFMYTSDIISYEEYQIKMEEFGRQLNSLDNKRGPG